MGVILNKLKIDQNINKQLKSRTLSDIKPMKPKKCEFDSNDCTPVCKYYKTCIHSLHKQAVSLHI